MRFRSSSYLLLAAPIFAGDDSLRSLLYHQQTSHSHERCTKYIFLKLITIQNEKNRRKAASFFWNNGDIFSIHYPNNLFTNNHKGRRTLTR